MEKIIYNDVTFYVGSIAGQEEKAFVDGMLSNQEKDDSGHKLTAEDYKKVFSMVKEKHSATEKEKKPEIKVVSEKQATKIAATAVQPGTE